MLEKAATSKKNMKSLWKGQRLRKANIMEGNAFFLEKMSKNSVESLGDTDVQIVLYIPLSTFPSGELEFEQFLSGKANDQRESVTCCFRPALKPQMGKIQRLLLVNPLWCQVITLRGPFW